ncbi:hypothetical protein Tco_1223734, partial [Tanacetum coccineum]
EHGHGHGIGDMLARGATSVAAASGAQQLIS